MASSDTASPAPASGAGAPASRASAASPAGTLIRRNAARSAPLLLLSALFIATVVSIEGFLTKPSISSVLVISSLLGLASLGQTLTVMVRGIDLSIPAVMTMGNIISIMLLQHGWPFWLVVMTVGVLAVIVGSVNAILSSAMNVHPLVVTLATGLIVSGIVLTVTNGGSVNGTLPAWVTEFITPIGTTWFIPLPGIVVTWILVTALMLWGQRGTRFGRILYAVGSSPVAARLAHARVAIVWLVVYQISALMAALTGILLAAFSGSASVAVSEPYLFMTVAAVVVGGTSLLGGSGGYGQTVLGVFVVQLLTLLVLAQGFSTYVQGMALGIMLILLVSIYGRDDHVRRRI